MVGQGRTVCQTLGGCAETPFWKRTSDRQAPTGKEDMLGALACVSHLLEPRRDLEGSRQLDTAPPAAGKSLQATSASTAFGHQNPCLNAASSQENPTSLGIHPEAEVYSDHLKPPEGSRWVRDTQPLAQASNRPLRAGATSGNPGSPQSPQVVAHKQNLWVSMV